MIKSNYIINNSMNDASTNFETVVNMQMDQAADNKAPFMWTITFIKSDALNSRSTNTPLQIEVPIMASYPGYTREEAVKAIMCYIQKQIKDKANTILADNAFIKAKSNASAIEFLSSLDICKNLDIDGKIQQMGDEYFSDTAELIQGTRSHIAQCKFQGKAVAYGNVEIGKKKNEVYILPFIINNSNYDASAHFDLVIYDKIQMANEMNKTIMFTIDFIRTDSMNPTAVNTPIQIIVPLLPIKNGLENPQYKQITENQKNLIMQYIKNEIESKYQEIIANKNPASQKEVKQIVDFLKQLDVCKGIDLYDSDKMVSDARRTILNMQNQPN